METLWRDLKYGARQLARNPGFTAVAVLTLALGIGANTAIFSVVNKVLLQPLPFPDPDQLVIIWSSHPKRGVLRFPVDPADFEDYREHNTVFQNMGIGDSYAGAVRGNTEPRRVVVGRVSSGYFSTLGVKPLLGRTLDDQPGRSDQPAAAVLSYAFWQSYFGGDREVLGRTLFVDQASLTIIGVMPADFESIGGDAQLWRLLDSGYGGGRGSYTMLCIARLKPGVTTKHAQAEMDSIAAGLAQEHPRLKTGVGALVESLPKLAVRDVRTALLTVWGVVGFVLLIACANVAGLLLTRAASREKEIAVRLALGAGRGRLIRQMLTEGMLLALLGGAAGCLLAAWGIEALRSLGASNIPRIDDVTLDNTVLAFACGLSLLVGLVAGAIPAVQSGSPDLSRALRESGRQTHAGVRQPVRSALVVFQLTLAVVALIGALLLVRSYGKLVQEDPGFSPENLLTARLEPVRVVQYQEGDSVEHYWRQRAGERETMNQFYQQLLNAIEALPDVRSAAAVNQLPLQGTYWAVLLTFEGRPPSPPGEAPAAQARVVTPGYFQTMQISLRRGRTFTRLDDAGSPRVAIIDETMARMYWPGEDPIGKRITTEDPAHMAWLRIIGVVGDVRPVSLAEPPRPTLYVPFAQSRLGFADTWRMNLVIRAQKDPLALVPGVRTLVWGLNENLPVSNISTMEEILAGSLARRRFSLFLLSLFALVALLLAAVGVYGMVSYTVAQRTHEIGIRMALGAHPSAVLRMVVWQGIVLSLAGLGLGWLAALALTRFLASLLFGVSPADPLTFGAASALLLGVALLACYLPARRAARVDPLVALRYE